MYDDAEHPELSEKLQLLRGRLTAADAYVFVSPEWNGMMSLSILNMLHYIKHEMSHKPVMLVGVSSGRGGTHPLDQMRLLGQKNRHYVLSPENLIISGVKDAFNSAGIDEAAADYALTSRADYALRILWQYAGALGQVRASGVIDTERFANGV